MLCEYDKMILDGYGDTKWTNFLSEPEQFEEQWNAYQEYFYDNVDVEA